MKARQPGHGRERAIERVKRRLLRHSTPRLQMSLIMLVTGAAGFLVSFTLLHTGVTSMWFRYPLAVLLAYAVFLLMLRLWLYYQQRAARRRHGADFDLSTIDPNVADFGSGANSGDVNFNFGGGGDFGGGGAGGSWNQGVEATTAAHVDSNVGGGGSSVGGGGIGLDFDLDLDELWFVVIALILVLGGLVASFYVIYIAPALLAEILVDGLLVSALYKRVRKEEQANWLAVAVRKTVVPVLLVAALFTAGGLLLQTLAPDAQSIGGVWRSIRGDKRR
ncbi:MAG: hypothetical protein LC754_17970 [Acidobacteria bacterium]|nr:hypothetical protein [Acidobacteriota bacterium]